jgi:hypothetical protein
MVLAVSMTAAGEGSVGYEYDTDNRILYVTIENGHQELPAECIPILRDNSVTNFMKLGLGTLSVSDDLTLYEGDITVHEGTYSFTTNAALGKLSNLAGTVYVDDGATLDYDPQSAASGWYTKRIVFGGSGVNGIGALTFTGNASNSRMCFGSNLVMRTDALIRNKQNNQGPALHQTGGAYPIWLDMNGHTLTFAGGIIVWGNLNVLNPGHFIVSNVNFTVTGSKSNFGGGPENTFTYCNSSGTLKFNSMSANTSWTFIPEKFSKITSDATGISSGTNGNGWAGPVELTDGQKLEVQPRNGHFSFKGPITGNGWLSVAGNAQGGHLHLFSSNNSFTGGAVGYQATYHLWNDGTLPINGGSLSLTNSSVRLENPDVVYNLPMLEMFASNTVSGGEGNWLKVIKDGEGTAVWNSLSGSDILDVKSGTVSFQIPRRRFAGLIESHRTYYDSNTGVNNDWTALKVSTNRVTLSAEAYYDLSHHLWKDPIERGNRYTFSYTGYIWNNEPTNVTWSFAGCAFTHIGVTIDRTNRVFRWIGNGSGTEKGSVNVSPGPHHFDVRGYCTSANPTKASDSRLEWPTSNFAVGFDPLGRNSNKQADYQKLVDPGDGSLLTWDVPSQVVGGVATVPGADNTINAWPVFRKMRFSVGAGVELPCSYILESLEGFPIITGEFDSFTVTSNWTVRADEIVAGEKLTTSGRLVFGSDATISMDGRLPCQDSYPKVFVIARSGEPDESLPEIARNEHPGWIVRRSDDRLDIELVQVAKGLRIILQ